MTAINWLASLAAAAIIFPCCAQSPASPAPEAAPADSPAAIDAVPKYGEPWMKPKPEKGVDWKGLTRSSLLFLGLQHGFRLATEQGTREALRNPFLSGYLESVGSLHGWSDGDPFLVNYVGHPMQGASAGYIWVNHDREYRAVEFGDGRAYWRSRMRATIFSAIYSTQFEIGPLSEATIGQVQRYYPQHGFVDQAVTPLVGAAWMVGEDALDKYVIRPLERRIGNRWIQMALRGGLNPSRSWANAVSLRVPWERDTRPGVFSGKLKEFYEAQDRGLITKPKPAWNPDTEGEFGVAFVEVAANYRPVLYRHGGGTATCQGGGAEMGLKVSRRWQALFDVSGCQIRGLTDGWSGDSLSYLAGARWLPRPASRWSPYLQSQIGGMQVTKEKDRQGSFQDSTVTLIQTHRLAVAAGGGLDLRLHPAFSLRLANLEYKRFWGPEEGPLSYNNSVSFSLGLVLRAGTW